MDRKIFKINPIIINCFEWL